MLNRPLDSFDPRKLNCPKHNQPLLGIIMKNSGEGNRLLCLQCLKNEAKSKTLEFEEIHNILSKKALDLRLQDINGGAGKLGTTEKITAVHDMIDNVFDDMVNVVQAYRREVKKKLTSQFIGGNEDDENLLGGKEIYRNLQNLLDSFTSSGFISDGEPLENYVKQFILLSKVASKAQSSNVNPFTSIDSLMHQAKFILQVLESNLKGMLGGEAVTPKPTLKPFNSIPLRRNTNDEFYKKNSQLPALPIQHKTAHDNLNSSLLSPEEYMRNRERYTPRRNLQPIMPVEPLDRYERGNSLPMKKYQNYYEKDASPPYHIEKPRSDKEIRGGYEEPYRRVPSETRTRPDSYDRRKYSDKDRNNGSEYHRGPGDDRSELRDKEYYPRSEKSDPNGKADSRSRIRSERSRDEPYKRRSSREELRDRPERDQKQKSTVRKDKVREADLNKRYDEMTTDDEQGRRRRTIMTPSESSRAQAERRREKEPSARKSKPKPLVESESEEVNDPQPIQKPTIEDKRINTENSQKSGKRSESGAKQEKKPEPTSEEKPRRDPPLEKKKTVEERKSDTKERAATPVKKVTSEKVQPAASDSKQSEKNPPLLANSLNKSTKPEEPADFNEFDTGMQMLSSIAHIEGHDYVAVGGLKAIKIISTKTWKQVSSEEAAHKSYVNKLVYSVPLKMLFSCSSDGIIKGWKVDTDDKFALTLVKEFTHPEAVYGMEIYNQETIISCGMFKSIYFWSINSSNKSEIKTKGSSSFQAVKVIPWLGAIAVSSFDQGNIWLFDIATQTLKFKLEGFNRNCFVSHIEYDTNEKKIYAAGSEGKIICWDVSSQTEKLIRGTEIYNLQQRFRLGGFSLDIEEKKLVAAGTGRVRDDCILVKVDMSQGLNSAKEVSVFRNQKSEKFSIAFADIRELNLVLFGLSSKSSGKLAAVNRLKI